MSGKRSMASRSRRDSSAEVVVCTTGTWAVTVTASVSVLRLIANETTASLPRARVSPRRTAGAKPESSARTS